MPALNAGRVRLESEGMDPPLANACQAANELLRDMMTALRPHRIDDMFLTFTPRVCSDIRATSEYQAVVKRTAAFQSIEFAPTS